MARDGNIDCYSRNYSFSINISILFLEYFNLPWYCCNTYFVKGNLQTKVIKQCLAAFKHAVGRGIFVRVFFQLIILPKSEKHFIVFKGIFCIPTLMFFLLTKKTFDFQFYLGAPLTDSDEKYRNQYEIVVAFDVIECFLDIFDHSGNITTNQSTSVCLFTNY